MLSLGINFCPVNNFVFLFRFISVLKIDMAIPKDALIFRVMLVLYSPCHHKRGAMVTALQIFEFKINAL